MNKNIVLVTVDCLRNDYYNSEQSDYKFLEFIKNHSSYYSNCYNLADNTSSCIPQLLSSTYLNLIPYKKHLPGEVNVMCQIKEPRISIAESLKDEGYNTYCFQTAPHLTPAYGFDKGFDNYNYFSPFKSKSQNFLDLFSTYPLTKAEEVNKSIMSNNFLEPYFLWIHYSDTHDPYVSTSFPLFVSNFLWYKFNQRPSIKQSADLQWPPVSKNFTNRFKSLYEKQVRYIDNCLYSLFVETNKFDIDNSVFVLTSDHGQSFGEYNQIGHGYRLLPTPEVSNVPLYISAPNQIEGTVEEKTCTLLDLVPTINELVDVPQLEIYDGNSLLSNEINDSIIWSNTLDFDNSKFLLKIIDNEYIFWQDDFNFEKPRIYKINGKELQFIESKELMAKFNNLASEHIENIRKKQSKYATIKNNPNVEETLDPDVYKALKALRYV